MTVISTKSYTNRYSWIALSLAFFLVSSCQRDTKAESSLFDVYFIIMLDADKYSSSLSKDAMLDEIDILNTYFRSADGQPLPRFNYSGLVYTQEIASTSCDELVRLGKIETEYDGSHWNTLINECDDPRIANPNAINLYVYDSWTLKRGFSDKSSHGRNNDDWPYILLDRERLGHQIQSPEEHEMGHAFGLRHRCVEGATGSSSTNIMASASCGKGSGGRRDLGFDRAQLERIWRNARDIRQRIGG